MMKCMAFDGTYDCVVIMCSFLCYLTLCVMFVWFLLWSCAWHESK